MSIPIVRKSYHDSTKLLWQIRINVGYWWYNIQLKASVSYELFSTVISVIEAGWSDTDSWLELHGFRRVQLIQAKPFYIICVLVLFCNLLPDVPNGPFLKFSQSKFCIRLCFSCCYISRDGRVPLDSQETDLLSAMPFQHLSAASHLEGSSSELEEVTLRALPCHSKPSLWFIKRCVRSELFSDFFPRIIRSYNAFRAKYTQEM